MISDNEVYEIVKSIVYSKACPYHGRLFCKEDLIGVGWVGAMNGRASYSMNYGEEKTWLSRSIMGEIQNVSRKMRRADKVSDMLSDCNGWWSERDTKNNELLLAIDKCLTPSEKIIIKQYYFIGYSMTEIANRYKVARQTISNKHSLAIRKLKECLL